MVFWPNIFSLSLCACWRGPRIEKSKRRRRGGNVEGCSSPTRCPPPQPTEGSIYRERRKRPSRIWRSPGRSSFGSFRAWKNTSDSDNATYLTSEAGTRFKYPGWSGGWVDLGDRLQYIRICTERRHQSVVFLMLSVSCRGRTQTSSRSWPFQTWSSIHYVVAVSVPRQRNLHVAVMMQG